MDNLLDPKLSDQDFIILLEQSLNLMYSSPNQQERNAAQNVLTQLQNAPDVWIRVDKVLDNQQCSSSAKFFALQIMGSLIEYRWKALPRQTCEQIRSYIVQKVIEMSSDEATLKKEQTYVTKLNVILVQIVKKEWPQNWRSFMTDLVGASKTSIPLCENNMNILALLSEEVFDFSQGQMTEQKINDLKNQFNIEFSQVFQLCQYVFKETKDIQDSAPSLINATLTTLEKFLTWVPLVYIFETDLIETVVEFIKKPRFRTNALRCLVEIASLTFSGSTYDQKFQLLYLTFVKYLVQVLSPDTDIKDAFDDADDDTQNFVMDLAMFFGAFFKGHLKLLENDSTDLKDALLIGLQYMVNLSWVNEVEIFKTCVEWWHKFASDLYTLERSAVVDRRPGSLILGASIADGKQASNLALYAPILSKTRYVLISRMAKPEEILIVEDENGEIVRETTKDTDAIALYKTMRETLVFFTHLNFPDTQRIMLEKLTKQCNGTEWSWNNLSTLCWAIGSISGAMNEEEEKTFLVTVIKDLLQLCEVKVGKDNKAVVASNIMYVVGQYPRFLRSHWKFLKTVVNKLFEFMHETHPGVQDMACDTFLKISRNCRSKFTTVQPNESRAFIVDILQSIPQIIKELEPHQLQSFYESCGCIIASCPDENARKQLILKLFELPNQSWKQLIDAANQNQDFLAQRDCMKRFVNILKTNAKVASSLGASYLFQLNVIYSDLLMLYKIYSTMISGAVATQGPIATKTADCRNMRAVKKECIRVLEAFIANADFLNRSIVLTQVVEPISQSMLEDYYNSVPEARDAEVLSLFTEIINYMRGLSVPAVQLIFKSLFSCTLDMIKNNFEDFPEARIYFFELLRAINQNCFASLFELNPDAAAAEADFHTVINAIIWAFKHTERNVAETGLQILFELLVNVDPSSYVTYFYRNFFRLLLNDILSVLTDTLHRSGFSYQCKIIMHLVQAVNKEKFDGPIWDINSPDDVNLASFGTSPSSNVNFVSNHLMRVLSQAFPNMRKDLVTSVVHGMMTINSEKQFKSHMRDFLVQTKEFSAGDNSELYDDERKAGEAEQRRVELERLQRIPGLAVPVPGPDDDMS